MVTHYVFLQITQCQMDISLKKSTWKAWEAGQLKTSKGKLLLVYEKN